MSDVITFGAYLREMRKTRRWTQTALAAHLSIDNSGISHMESGRRMPTVVQLHELAIAFATRPESPVDLDEYRSIVARLVSLAYTTIRVADVAA